MAAKAKGVAGFKATATPSLALLLNPLAWVLWILDFALWFATFGWIATLKHLSRGPYSVEVGPAVRRNCGAVDGLSTSPVPAREGDVRTTAALLDHVAAKYGPRRAMGTREYLGDYRPEGAKFPLKKFGETSWLTFAEVHARARRFGAALVDKSIAMRPLPPGADVEAVDGPHTVLLFEDTCAEWMICALGALGQGLVVATSYATLGIDAVAEALNNSQCPVIVCNFSKIAECAALKSKCKDLTTVIYTHHFTSKEDLAKGAPECPGLKVISFDDVCKLSAKTAFTPPSPSTISVIMCELPP